MAEKSVHCELAKRCGGCTYMGMSYEQQVEGKPAEEKKPPERKCVPRCYYLY